MELVEVICYLYKDEQREIHWNSGERWQKPWHWWGLCCSGTCKLDSFSEIPFTVHIPEVGRGRQGAADITFCPQTFLPLWLSGCEPFTFPAKLPPTGTVESWCSGGVTAYCLWHPESTIDCPFTRELGDKDSEPPPGGVKCSCPLDWSLVVSVVLAFSVGDEVENAQKVIQMRPWQGAPPWSFCPPFHVLSRWPFRTHFPDALPGLDFRCPDKSSHWDCSSVVPLMVGG